MSLSARRPPFGRVFEYLVLAVLGIVFARGAYGEFSHASAEVLDPGTDPRLLILDLVTAQQLARSTKLPHEIRFTTDDAGSIRGYTLAVKANYGEPWAVLRSRTFPDGLKVSSSQPRLLFGGDGSAATDCRVRFDEDGRQWLVTVAGGSGELRMTDARRAVE